MKKKQFTEIQRSIADINNDGKVNSLDYIKIKKIIMKGTYR
jgi:hypothetical protein